MGKVAVSGVPLRAGLRLGAIAGDGLSVGYDVQVLNMSGRTAPLRLYGVLTYAAGGSGVLGGAESSGTVAIPTSFALLADGPGRLWQGTAGNVVADPGGVTGGCPFAVSGVTSCALTSFAGGYAVTESVPAVFPGNAATGPQTASLPTASMPGVKLTVDCAQATGLAAALLCRWLPLFDLTVALEGAGSVASTPVRPLCYAPGGTCAWSFPYGTSVTLTATPLGDASFTDGELAGDWTTTPLTGGDGGSAASSQVASGGNPGAFRRVSLTMNAAPGQGQTSAVTACFFKSTATYDPRPVGEGGRGPIASLDYAQDHRSSPGPQFVALAVRQNGNHYLADYRYADGRDWVRYAATGLTSASFFRQGTDPFRQYAEGPDLSASGGPLEFGFCRGASTADDGPGYTTTADVDNWQVIVRRVGAATPQVTWTGCPIPSGATCTVRLTRDTPVGVAIQ